MLKEPGANLVRVFDLHELSLAVAAQNPHEANPFSRAVGLMCFRMAQKWRPPGCSTVELRQRRELLLQCVERLKVAEQPLLCSLAHAQLAERERRARSVLQQFLNLGRYGNGKAKF